MPSVPITDCLPVGPSGQVWSSRRRRLLLRPSQVLHLNSCRIHHRPPFFFGLVGLWSVFWSRLHPQAEWIYFSPAEDHGAGAEGRRGDGVETDGGELVPSGDIAAVERLLESAHTDRRWEVRLLLGNRYS